MNHSRVPIRIKTTRRSIVQLPYRAISPRPQEHTELCSVCRNRARVLAWCSRMTWSATPRVFLESARCVSELAISVKPIEPWILHAKGCRDSRVTESRCICIARVRHIHDISESRRTRCIPPEAGARPGTSEKSHIRCARFTVRFHGFGFRTGPARRARMSTTWRRSRMSHPARARPLFAPLSPREARIGRGGIGR
jgi:hypothetical protein